MTGLIEVDELSSRTDELIREAVTVSVEAERQADELDRSITMLREEVGRWRT